MCLTRWYDEAVMRTNEKKIARVVLLASVGFLLLNLATACILPLFVASTGIWFLFGSFLGLSMLFGSMGYLAYVAEDKYFYYQQGRTIQRVSNFWMGVLMILFSVMAFVAAMLVAVFPQEFQN